MLHLMPVLFLIAILAAFGLAAGAGTPFASYLLLGLYLTMLATSLVLGSRPRV